MKAIKMQAKTDTNLSALELGVEASLSRAIIIMKYWNQNQFEGRYKTKQTEWAEQRLRESGIDPATVGVAKRIQVVIHRN